MIMLALNRMRERIFKSFCMFVAAAAAVTLLSAICMRADFFSDDHYCYQPARERSHT